MLNSIDPPILVLIMFLGLLVRFGRWHPRHK
jgi:hypothetical protein